MLFLTYWELNEQIPYDERMRIAKRMTESGVFPPKDVKIIRWDSTPDGWGITLCEAKNVEDITRAINLWRAAAPAFFKFTRTAPAAPARDAIKQGIAIANEMKGVDLSLISHN